MSTFSQKNDFVMDFTTIPRKMVPIKINANCRWIDVNKIEVEKAFVPIYSVMFILAVVLNSFLLYVVIKKENVIKEKRTFHKLFQALITLDLFISILILPQIIIKVYTLDRDVNIPLEVFIGIRDFTISSQMMVLVLVALDRLLAFVIPMGTCWRLKNVEKVLCFTLSIPALFYSTRFILLSVPLNCNIQIIIDRYAKNIIGVSGGIFMSSVFIMYLILLVLICKRQVKRQKSLISPVFKEENPIAMKEIDSDNVRKDCIPSPIPKMRSKIESTRHTLTRKIGSIKFAKVLFGVNILMISSFLPGILYNGRLIKFPSYSVYYLFFLHALGDPLIFFLSRKELKNGLISIFVKNT